MPGLQHLFKEDPLGKGFNPEAAANASTIRAFDDAITRVSFDWPSVDAYYAGKNLDTVCKILSELL